MQILYDGNIEQPQILIKETLEGLGVLGNRLNSIDSHIFLKDDGIPNKFYKINLDSLDFIVEEGLSNHDRICIELNGNLLHIRGTCLAMANLGQSLLNIFDKDAMPGEHMHLDYFEGNQLVDKTTCYVVVECL